MLTLKYRPKSFKDFIGNDDIINGLLSSYPKWSSTFLLTGSPGVGKTTLGRLIAKQVECLPVNLIEIDAGQDRGIDNIRTLIKGAYNKPLIGKAKVYIIDECQGLTKDAQQALLKITEEAPPNTYFVFCSTDPQKIIKALRTRCQLINLMPLTPKVLAQIILKICEEEQIKLEGIIKDIARVCVQNADGIPRRAIMLFDTYKNYENIDIVLAEINRKDDSIPKEMWEYSSSIEKDFIKFVEDFNKNYKGHYEQFRIVMGHIFKKKLMFAIQRKDRNTVLEYTNILRMFDKPVDDNLGDIELAQRFGEYYLEISA